MIPKEETPLATVTTSYKALQCSNNDERLSISNNQLQAAADDNELQQPDQPQRSMIQRQVSSSSSSSLSLPTNNLSQSNDSNNEPKSVFSSLETTKVIETNDTSNNMTPSNKSANYTGSSCHNTLSKEPEQLHKEPVCASGDKFSSAAAATSNSVKSTKSQIDITNYFDGNSILRDHQGEENILAREDNMRFEWDDSNTLTSLVAHVDKVSRELDLLACSTLAPTITLDQVVEINESISDKLEIGGKSGASRLVQDQAKMRDEASSSSSSSVTNDFVPTRKVSQSKVQDHVDMDEVRSLSGSTASSEEMGYRPTSGASFTTINQEESIGQLERQLNDCSVTMEHDKRKHNFNNTIFILQHLMQKRSELRIIDKRLYETIGHYLAQLNLSYSGVKWPDEYDLPSLALINEEQDKFGLSKERKQILGETLGSSQYEASGADSISKPLWLACYEEDSYRTERHDLTNEAMDLRIEKFQSESSILLPATSIDEQDSTYESTATTTTGNNVTGSTTTAIRPQIIISQDRKLISSTTNQIIEKQNSTTSTNDTVSQTIRQTKPNSTINLKKSRLLGQSGNFSLVSYEQSASSSQALESHSTMNTTIQQDSIRYNNNDNNNESGNEDFANKTSPPLNLRSTKRYKLTTSQPLLACSSSSQSATISTSPEASPATSSTAVTDISMLDHRTNNQISNYQQTVILAPVTPPTVVISPPPRVSSPLSKNHYRQQQMLLDQQVNESIEPLDFPSAKRFRSVAQMIDSQHQENQQLTCVSESCYEAQVRQYCQLVSGESRDFLTNVQRQNQTQLIASQPQVHENFTLNYSQQFHSSSNITAAPNKNNNNNNSLAQLNHNNDANVNLSLNNQYGTNNTGSSDQNCCSDKLVPTIVCADQSSYIQQQPMFNQNSDNNCSFMISTNSHQLATHSSCQKAPLTTIHSARLSARENLNLIRAGNLMDKEHLSHEQHQQQLAALPALARLIPGRDFQKVAGYRCHVCGSGFEDRHRLQQHLSIHLILHPSWYEEKTIKETMARYESKRGDYLCASCQQRFETTSEFDRHMHLHREKPHSCELCSQDNKMVSFRYYRQLLTHLRSHCFLYSCRFTSDCRQTANRKDYLKLHILKHHLNNKLPEQFTVCCH